MGKYVRFYPYVGGKYYLLEHILSLITEHSIYVEVFGGSGKVLLNKPKSKIEVWNDYDKRLANLFYVVAFKFEEFYGKVRALIYSRELYSKVIEELKKVGKIELGDVDAAVKTYYMLCCVFSGNGLNNNVSRGSFKYSKLENMAEVYWRRLHELGYIRERLSGVIVECEDFENVIKRWDSEETFFYLDPPYYGVNNYYGDFRREDHERLLKLLKEVKGKWLLSGYGNELYDKELEEFNRYEFHVTKRSFCKDKRGLRKKPKAVEVLWCNYKIRRGLFSC
jgi:DNA adenine methylase